MKKRASKAKRKPKAPDPNQAAKSMMDEITRRTTAQEGPRGPRK